MGAIGSPIVVGYVDSPEGQAALQRAVDEASQRGARLIVINSHKGGSALDKNTAVELDESLDEVHTRLHDSGRRARGAPAGPRSDPRDDLIAVAEEVDADLIVIGLRRRTPVGKLILGSNAQQVLLDAQLPRARRQGP